MWVNLESFGFGLDKNNYIKFSKRRKDNYNNCHVVPRYYRFWNFNTFIDTDIRGLIILRYLATNRIMLHYLLSSRSIWPVQSQTGYATPSRTFPSRANPSRTNVIQPRRINRYANCFKKNRNDLKNLSSVLSWRQDDTLEMKNDTLCRSFNKKRRHFRPG